MLLGRSDLLLSAVLTSLLVQSVWSMAPELVAQASPRRPIYGILPIKLCNIYPGRTLLVRIAFLLLFLLKITKPKLFLPILGTASFNKPPL
jgi:hypothetical protein